MIVACRRKYDVRNVIVRYGGKEVYCTKYLVGARGR